jgi:hypothetical protein
MYVFYIGNRQTLIKRKMLPLVLCWALCFHKTQGKKLLIFDENN